MIPELCKQINYTFVLFDRILIRLVCAAVFPLFYPKQNQIALVYHCKVTVIDCRVPIIKILCRTLQRFIFFSDKPSRRLYEVIFERKAKHPSDTELWISASLFGYKVVAQIVEITSAAEQKNPHTVLYCFVDFCSRSCYQVIRYIDVGMPETRTSLFNCFHKKRCRPRRNGTAAYRSVVATPINLFSVKRKSGTGITTNFLTFFLKTIQRLPPCILRRNYKVYY